MIDERNSVTVRHVHINNRFSESVPDYDDVKVRYSVSKFAFNYFQILPYFQIRMNITKTQVSL